MAVFGGGEVTAQSATGERIAGIDRRTVGPALLVLALAVAMGVILPSIDSETSYRDEVHRGEVVQIADGITLVPTPGWELAGGALAGETRSPIGTTASTELIRSSVKFSVQAAPFEGTPSQLLERIRQINADLGSAHGATRRYPVTTRQGAVGVAKDYVGVNKQASEVAFVLRSRSSDSGGHATREGVEIVVSGPKSAISRRRDDIVAMIRSLRTTP
jgi:hypothetical protein